MDCLKFLIKKTYALNLLNLQKSNYQSSLFKNSTLMRWFKFWQFNANFTVSKEFLSQLYLIPLFCHRFLLETLLISQENLSFIATFTLVKKTAPILPMLF